MGNFLNVSLSSPGTEGIGQFGHYRQKRYEKQWWYVVYVTLSTSMFTVFGGYWWEECYTKGQWVAAPFVRSRTKSNFHLQDIVQWHLARV